MESKGCTTWREDSSPSPGGGGSANEVSRGGVIVNSLRDHPHPPAFGRRPPPSRGRLRKDIRQPVRALRAPAVGAIVGDVVAVLDQQEGARPLHLVGQALRMLPRDQPV